MCMEDIRIGRRKVSRMYFVDVSTSWTRIAAANPRRTRLEFNHNSTASAFWYNDPNVSTSTGIHFTRTTPPVVIDVEQHGQLATGEIWAVSASGTIRVSVIETVLQEE